MRTMLGVRGWAGVAAATAVVAVGMPLLNLAVPGVGDLWRGEKRSSARGSPARQGRTGEKP